MKYRNYLYARDTHTKMSYVIYIAAICAITGVYSQDIGEFYPYGSGTSDQTLPNGNDLSTFEITLSTRLYFYGVAHETIYVNTNGVITLNDPLPDPMVEGLDNKFPLHPRIYDGPMIAPFWADVDTSSSNRGNIYYRQSTESGLLSRVSSDVQDIFLLHADYIATWVFVATWDDVSFFNHNTAANEDPRNTFQVVLTTDGFRSFAFYRYQTVVWAAGTDIGGDAVSGDPDLQQHQAVVGFNEGDGYGGYQISTPEDVRDLPGNSNVEVNGLYAFQIDEATGVTPGGCKYTASTVVTFPVYGNMFGGEKVYLNGPCWSPSDADTLKCRFMYEGTVLQIANGTVEDRQTAYCVPDPFFMVGEVAVEVSINDFETWYDGTYMIVYPTRVTDIPRVTMTAGDFSMADNPLTISWDSGQYSEDTLLDIHTIAYREDGNEGPRWEVVYAIGTGVTNAGSLTFTPTAVDTVTEDNAFGLIRVQPTNGGVGSKIYSNVQAFGYILNEGYQNNPIEWSNEKCEAWGEADDLLINYADGLLPCPCTLDQALADSGRFQQDTGCSMFAGSVCTYHVGAKHCVRSVFASEDHAGTQCCYDQDGYLMFAGDSDQGSTNDRSHVWGSEPYLEEDMVPSLSHWKHDVITFYYCCIWGTECRTYMERRITMDCTDYEPPEHAITFGDPHIITLDNTNYTFNGKGEFSLLEADAASGFRLEGRFEFIPAFSSGSSQQDGSTGLTAAVMFDGFSEVVTVEKDDISGLALYRGVKEYDASSNLEVNDWERINFRDQTWLDLPGFSVTINEVDSDNVITSLTVMFKSSEMGVNVTRGGGQDILSVTVIIPPELKGSTSLVGLLGNYNDEQSDDLQERNGNMLDPVMATDEEIYLFGLTWATPETKLFRYASGTSYDYYSNTTVYNPVFVAPDESSLTPSEQSFMDQTCGDIQQCRFDYAVTRDQDMAYGTAYAAEHYEWAEANTIKIISCPYYYTPLNGTKEYTQEVDGDVTNYKNNFVGTTVRVECGEGYVLVGSTMRTCQEDGTYSGSETESACIASPCGSLPVVENGYMSFSEFDGTQVVVVTCDDGYSLEGSSRHECNGDNWTGETSSCTNSSNGGKIAGIVIGSLIGAALLIVVCGFCFMQVKKQATKPKNKPKTARPVYYDPNDPSGPHSITQISVNNGAGKKDPATDDYEKISVVAPSVRSSNAGTMHNAYQDEEDDDDVPSMTQSYPGGDRSVNDGDLSSLASSMAYKGYDEAPRGNVSHLDI